MKRRLLNAGRVILFAALALGIGAGWLGSYGLGAERPVASELLPKRTVVYVRVRDVQELKEKFSQTAMGRMAKDPQVRPLLRHLYGSAVEAFLSAESEIGLSLDELLQVPQGEMCFAVVAPEQGLPAPFFLMDLGERPDDGRLLLDSLVRRLSKEGYSVTPKKHHDVELRVCNRSGEQQFIFFEHQNAICVTMAEDFARDMLDMWDQGKDVQRLRDNPKFVQIMQSSGGTRDETPQVTFFVDPVLLIKVASRGNISQQLTITALEPLGWEGIQGIGGSMLFSPEEFDSLTHVHLLLETPRKALLNLLALRSGDTTPEVFVPRQANSYFTLHWDVLQTFTELEALINTFRGDGAVKRGLEQASQQLGVDVRDELINAFEGRFSMFTLFDKPLKLNSQTTVMAAKLKDPAKFRQTLDKITKKFTSQFDLETQFGIPYYKIPIGERQLERMNQNQLIRIPQPCFALFEGYFIYSDSENSLKEVFAARNSAGQQLSSHPDFQRIAQTIEEHSGGNPIGVIQYARPDETFRNMYEFIATPETRKLLEQNAERNPLLRAVNEALQANELPPFSVLAQYLAPGGAMVLDEENGYHYMAFGLRSK